MVNESIAKSNHKAKKYLLVDPNLSIEYMYIVLYCIFNDLRHEVKLTSIFRIANFLVRKYHGREICNAFTTPKQTNALHYVLYMRELLKRVLPKTLKCLQ